MIKQLLFILASICFFAPIALAEEEQQEDKWNRHQGFFGELNLGTNLYYLGMVTSEGEAASSGFHGFGWSIAGGYSFKPTHAIEAGFMQNYARYIDDSTSLDLKISTNTNIAYLAWRGTIPIRDRFAFFGKLGAMLISIPDTDEDTWVVLPYTGLGLSYALTQNIEINLQYQGAVYLIVGAGALTGGITYHF